MDIPLSDSELYYSGDNSEYFNLGKDAGNVKRLIDKNSISKVRIQKDINIHSKTDIVESVINAIKILEPYYNFIIKKALVREDIVSKSSKDICEWIIPCNVKYYDIIGAFKELKKIEWKQSVNIKVNDIV